MRTWFRETLSRRGLLGGGLLAGGSLLGGIPARGQTSHSDTLRCLPNPTRRPRVSTVPTAA